MFISGKKTTLWENVYTSDEQSLQKPNQQMVSEATGQNLLQKDLQNVYT